MTRHPVLRPGDTLRLGGQTHTVAGLDSATVRLADVTGAVTEVSTAGLLADPSLELVTAPWARMAPQPALERLPAEAVENARWWERHLIEVITGVPPGSPPGTGPRPSVSDFLCAGLFSVRYRMFIRCPLFALSDAVVPVLSSGLAESDLLLLPRADAACPGFRGVCCCPGRLLPDPPGIA